MPGDPFQIDILPEAPLSRAAFTVARPLLERVLALDAYRALYGKVQKSLEGPFESRALNALRIDAQISFEELDHIPRSGPVIVAANHPHGIVDGLVLMSALRRVRPDVRVLTNQLLMRIPELRDCCLFVDPFDGPDAEARNRAGLRAAHLWLRGGGALIVFPAGEVAHAPADDGQRADSKWKPAMSRLALATGAAVIPAFIGGRNSQAFYAAGRLHPALRTLLLPRELLKKRGSTIGVRLGAALSPAGWANDAAAFSSVVRSAVDQLAMKVRLKPDTTETPAPSAKATSVVSGFSRTDLHHPSAEPDAASVMADFSRTDLHHPPAEPDAASVVSGFSRTDPVSSEIAALASDCRLLESGPFQVFCARAEQIPAALREIGRLRAITFRAVGEGSDSELDLDRFDARYQHLFSWDNDKQQIVGAYRIGQTDQIVANSGVDGLYTRTLFRYDERLIERMPAPALELGRSFVRAEYQKNYNALLLLWKGIGRFVARHPEYRLLFGPVSISARYSDASHRLLMSFLRQNHFAPEFGELVAALHTPRVTTAPAGRMSVPRSLDEVNSLIERVEADGKGMPVLLRQYLKLNARLIGFNVDPAFSQTLDALMLVDLTTVDLPILNRYIGRGDATLFLAYHDASRTSAAA
jgi:putative hemolysin